MREIRKKIAILLNSDQKKHLLLLFFAMLMGALLETLSVTLVVPMIQAILDPELAEKNRYVGGICAKFPMVRRDSFLAFCIGALILVFIIKNLYMFWEQKLCAGFSSDCSRRLKNRMTDFYMHRSYEHFLTTNSNDIFQLIVNDTSAVVSIIQAILTILTESVIAIFLAAAIFFINPFMTTWAVFTMMVVVAVILTVIRPRTGEIGNQVIQHNIRRNSWLVQGLRGIKEIKTLRTEDYIVDHIEREAEMISRLECRNAVYASIPRMFVETVCICSMLGYLYLLVMLGVELEQVLPAVSAFAMAAVKLMPAAVRISAAVSLIHYRKKSLDRIVGALEDASDERCHVYGSIPCRTVEHEMADMLYMKDLSYRYPSGSRWILEHANAAFPLGQITCIIGESGVGKTTLADLLLGLLTPDSGEIYVNTEGKKEMKVGYIPQNSFMLDDSIKGNIAFGLEDQNMDEKKVMECLQAVGLDSFIKSLPDGLDTPIGEGGIRLSGGQRQRLGIARAIYRDCDFFILDEPTAALDKDTEFIVLDTIREMAKKRTFLIIAHNIYTIEACDVVYEVAGGTLVPVKEKKW